MSSGVRTGRRYFWFPSAAVFVLVVLIAAGCDFPRDPRGTLEGVQNGTMRVGIVENDPWTRMEEGHASGVEVELLKDDARVARSGQRGRGGRADRRVHQHVPRRKRGEGGWRDRLLLNHALQRGGALWHPHVR